MTQETRIALLLMKELVAVLLANDPYFFKQWIWGVQGLGEAVMVELLLD